MLKLNQISIRTKTDGFILIDHLSLTLNEGDKYAIIGLEGTGKSTLLKAIFSDKIVDYADVEGTITSSGKIGYLEQDIALKWGHYSTLQYLLKPSVDHPEDFERFEVMANLSHILEKVSFPEDAFHEEKKINQYSGGEIVKLGLAKLLLDAPDILLLDEPSNDLDFDTILFLEDFIKHTEKGMLYISHDEALLENTANGIIHLTRTHKKTKAKTYVERCDYQTYKSSSHQAFDSQRMVALKQRASHNQKVARFRRIYQKVEHQLNQTVRNPSQGRLLAKKMKSLKSQERRLTIDESKFIDLPEAEEPIEIYFDKTVGVPKGKTVLTFDLDTLSIDQRILSKNIHLSIKGPLKLCIIGTNGIGKTTLIKLIYDALRQRTDLSVAYMPQQYETLIDQPSALEFLMPEPDKKQEALIRKMMGSMNFEREEMTAKPQALSGGQKTKLYLLKMVLDKNNVLLMDEPTRNLSPLSAPKVYELLSEFGGCVIAVTHDRSFIENVFDVIYELTPQGLIER